MAPSARTGGVRVPPSYNVAAQMARLHRLGRAHSHEGVTTGGLSTNTTYFHSPTNADDDGEFENPLICLFFRTYQESFAKQLWINQKKNISFSDDDDAQVSAV